MSAHAAQVMKEMGRKKGEKSAFARCPTKNRNRKDTKVKDRESNFIGRSACKVEERSHELCLGICGEVYREKIVIGSFSESVAVRAEKNRRRFRVRPRVCECVCVSVCECECVGV